MSPPPRRGKPSRSENAPARKDERSQHKGEEEASAAPSVAESSFPAGLQHSPHFPVFLSNLFRRKKRHVFVEQRKFRRRHRLGNKFAFFAACCLLFSFAATTMLVSANSRQAWYRALWAERQNLRQNLRQNQQQSQRQNLRQSQQQHLGLLQPLATLREQHSEVPMLELEKPWRYKAFYIPSFDPETQLLLTDEKTQQALLLDSVLPQLAMQKTWRIYLVITALLALTTLAALVLWFRQVFVAPLADTVHAVHRFTDDPGNLMTMLIASDRADEIGFLQRELTRMQVVYRISLKQYQHLAALGGAVTKINHDLKGLLSTALIAGESLHKANSLKKRSKAKLFEAALERAIALCEQLLVYVREDKKPVFLTRVNLENLLHSLGADLQLHAKGILKVTTRLSPTLPVQGDADNLYRALRNLGQNAIEAHAQNLRITLTGDKKNAHIDIADDGPGLSTQAKQSLFKPFAPSSKIGGSGLGLSIAQELIKQHNGSLTLAQSNAQGTTFHCVFPIALGTQGKRATKQRRSA